MSETVRSSDAEHIQETKESTWGEQGLHITFTSFWRPALIAAMAIIIGFGVLNAVQLLARPLALFIFGIALAASMVPIVDSLSKALPRNVAIISIFVFLALIFIGLGWLISGALVDQARQFGERIPDLIDRTQIIFGQIRDESGGITENLINQVGTLGSSLVRLPLTLADMLFNLILVIFIALYFLIELPAMRSFALSLFPGGEREEIERLLAEMGNAMGGYVRGAIITGVIIGLLTYFGLLVIGFDYPLVMGLLAGVLELIPVVGPIIAGLVAVSIAFLDSPTQALVVLAYVTILQQIESNILTPNIMRAQTKISSLLAILAIFTGGVIGGLLGAIVAIPLAAALQVLFKRVVAPAVRKRTGAPQVETSEGQ